MTEILDAIKMKWDTPYRILASLLAIGCAYVLAGWATGPLQALGNIGAYLNVPQAQEVTGTISSWLTSHRAAVSPVAMFLVLLGVAANVGVGVREHADVEEAQIPGPWRGAPTALIALAAVWEVSPGSVPGTLGTLFVGMIAVLGVNYKDNPDKVRSWLFLTGTNMLGSALFIVAPLIWMIARPSSQEPRSAE